MDAEGGRADDVSHPEKTLTLWLKPLLSLWHSQPPAGEQITAEAEVFFPKPKQVSDSQGSKVNGNTSSPEHLF